MKLFYFFMFRDVPGCSGMFRNVPACSGMFRVQGFIDAPHIGASPVFWAFIDVIFQLKEYIF